MLSPSKCYVIFSKNITIANFFRMPGGRGNRRKTYTLNLISEKYIDVFCRIG